MRTSNSPRLLRKVIVAIPVLLCLAATAEAQLFPFLFGNQPRRQYYPPRQVPQQQFFNPFSPAPQERQADYSRAPAPRKSEIAPTTKIVVMGDSLADWLAYGLEDAFADTPEIGVVRKHRTYSGLLRYDSRPDSSWAQVVRETIAAERPDFVIMMLGINDRSSIRERSPATPRRPAADDQATREQTNQEQPEQDAIERPSPDHVDDEEQPAVAAPEQPQRPTSSTLEFRSDRWSAAYLKRIEETVAALKSANVPVIWVGLPALRGTRSTSEMIYLNGLYRAAAEKGGIVFADVWDGFVDEAGKFSVHGPDVEGQVRRLRTADGVHFTRFGARKLAHFVEREVQRLMANRAVPVALPAPDTPPPAATPARPGVPAPRPLAGPVLPLTATPASGDELLGATAARPANTDPLAAAVLIRGEAMTPTPGRADDFTWPRPAHVNFDTAPGATPAPPRPAPPPMVPVEPRRPAVTSSTPQPGASAARSGQPGPRAQQVPQTVNPNAPRPPAPVGGPLRGLFEIFR